MGPCPEKVDFYAEKDLRATSEIKTMIFSDSTLRQADVVGLSANITCMSDGMVWNVSHILQDSPAFVDHTNVVIVAGINDINTRRVFGSGDKRGGADKPPSP